MNTFRVVPLSLVVGAFGLAAVNGCSECIGAVVGERRLGELMNEYRFSLPPEELSSLAVELLREKGFHVTASGGPGKTVVATSWHYETSRRRRYEIELTPEGAGSRLQANQEIQAFEEVRWKISATEHDTEAEEDLKQRLAKTIGATADAGEELDGQAATLDDQVIVDVLIAVLLPRGGHLRHKNSHKMPTGRLFETNHWTSGPDERSFIHGFVTSSPSEGLAVEVSKVREQIAEIRTDRPPSSKRDYRFELHLVRDVDPEGARAIEAAKTEADLAAGRQANKLGVPSCAGGCAYCSTAGSPNIR